MVIAKGVIVDIGGIGRGVLAEEINLSLSTTFKSMWASLPEPVQKAAEVATVIGTSLRAITGVGVSGQVKQATAQIWDKTDPMSFNLNIDFHRMPLPGSTDKSVSAANMMKVVKRLCTLPLPRERLGVGVLEPPGPSWIEGLGIDQLMSFLAGKLDENSFVGSKVNAASNALEERSVDQKGMVDVTIGKLRFRRLLMRKAEPVFSKYFDESGYPISCRVAFEFISLYAATKNMVEEW